MHVEQSSVTRRSGRPYLGKHIVLDPLRDVELETLGKLSHQDGLVLRHIGLSYLKIG